MGFDTTLHLVDERAIADKLVPQLLASKKRLVLEGEPAEAARALTALAIAFASKTLPHVEARGMALSLWDGHAPKKVRGKSPLGLGSSPAVMFGAVIAKRKELKKHFPIAFDENYMTGVFIPAAKIAAARKWMEKELKVLTPAERLIVEPIERVLAAAEERGLAYWEATDLAVARSKEELGAGPTAKDVVGRWKVGALPEEVVGRVGDEIVLRLVNHSASVVHIAKLPPKVEKLAAMDYPTFVAKLGGRWIFVERRKDVTPWRFRLFDRGTSPSGKPVDAAPGWKGRAFVCIAILAGEVYGFDEDAAPRRLLRWTEKRFEAVAGVPPAKGKNGTIGTKYVSGAARTGDGGDVMIWDGDGWELRSGKLTKTFALDAKYSHMPWSSAPSGASGGASAGGSFFYLSNRQVFQAERGKKPKRAASTLTNVMRIAPGPNGSVLCRMGDNRNAWAVAAISAKRTATGLRLAELTKGDDRVVAFEWSESAGALVAITERAIIAVPRTKLGV